MAVNTLPLLRKIRLIFFFTKKKKTPSYWAKKSQSCPIKIWATCGGYHLGSHQSFCFGLAFHSDMDISLSDLQTSFQESNRKSVLIYSPVEGEIWISASSAGCLPVDINLLTWPGLDNRSWGVLIFRFARHQVINLPVGQRDSWHFLFAPEKTLGRLILHCLFSERLNYPQRWHVLPPEHLRPHKVEQSHLRLL